MRAPILLAAGVLATAGAAVLGQVRGASQGAMEDVGLVAGIALTFTVLGALVLMSRPHHPVGLFMTAAGSVAAVELLAVSWAGWTPAAWLSQWLWFPPLALMFLAILVFPTGRLPSPRWWPASAAIIAGAMLTSLLLAAAAIGEPQLLDYGQDRDGWVDALVKAARLTAVLTGLGCAAAVASLAVRWRRSEPGTDLRRQLATLIPCGLLMMAGVLLSVESVPGAWVLIAASVPFGMGVAMLRYRLFDVDLIVNRTIVWLVLTGVVIGVVALAIWLLSDALFSGAQSPAAMVGTGLVVVTFEPLHRRVQHSVDHLMYGDRDDPYQVISRLGALLRGTADPAAVMPLVTDTIMGSLQVPYVAMELIEGDHRVFAARSGRPVEVTESFDMVAHGEPVGRLIVGRRSKGVRFSRHERSLLEDLAVQAGIAAEASQMTRDLENLRDRLVAKRESELLRLRRELHDRLGPAFAGLRMQVFSARRATADPKRMDSILNGIDNDLSRCSLELREIINQMRPPALDRGLEAAIRAECARFSTSELNVTCEIEGHLTGLPNALEVAAYRIVAEALTNVARHAQASQCTVRLHREVNLVLVIADNGKGILPNGRCGIGTTSMSERAAELGGTRLLETGPSGTSVTVELPIGRAHVAAHTSTTPTHPRPSPVKEDTPT